MKFNDYNLSPNVKHNLEVLGFKKPTDIQFKSIKPILNGDDLLAIAQTGSGKTAAFAIPIIDLIHNKKKTKTSKKTSCLVMVPTRELAIQLTKVFKDIAKGTRVKVSSLYGGVQQDSQINQLDKGTDIIIATPGRMFDLRSQGYANLSEVEILVLDEADHMLDLGFYKDIEDVLKIIPKKHQTLFFSATINTKIKRLAYSLVNNPIHIQIAPKDVVSKNITHSVLEVKMDDKRYFLERLIKENLESKILIFVRTKVRAERVQAAMNRVNITCANLHGDIDQKEREITLANFKNGKIQFLIATDVAARGVDIPNVDFVVNYDMPTISENYVHRIGRTGRGKNKGTAISFCSNEENDLLKQIENFIGYKLPFEKMDKTDYLNTIDFSEQSEADWKTLLKSDNEISKTIKINKKRKKK